MSYSKAAHDCNCKFISNLRPSDTVPSVGCRWRKQEVHVFRQSTAIAGRCFVKSLQEGFGYPPVEAMHRGCPVLVADRTAFKHVVPRSECRFDPDDFDGFVGKLLQADAEPAAFLCPPNPAHSFEGGVARLGRFLRTLT